MVLLVFSTEDTEDAEATEVCATSQLRNNLWFFAAGMVVYGIGGATLYTVGTGYIDDSVTAVYSPVFLGRTCSFIVIVCLKQAGLS